MTGHEYLQGVLTAQRMHTGDLQTLRGLRDQIEGSLRQVYGSIPRFYYGGSYGKDCLIQASFDLDLVMYFPSTDTRPLQALYYRVMGTLQQAGYIVSPKNVALRLPYQGGFHIDVVPGRAQDATYYYATLFKSEENSTRQTSIKKHIDTVRKSDVREVIKLMKLWRLRHSVDWSSFALEQTVIRALSGSRSKADLAASMWEVLGFLQSNIQKLNLIDPANTNNVIDISSSTRLTLMLKAAASRGAKTWEEIVW